MTAQDFISKWEGVSEAAQRVSEETGESVPLVIVSARLGAYEEIQVELPRRALPEVRQDIKSLGGAFRAVFV